VVDLFTHGDLSNAHMFAVPFTVALLIVATFLAAGVARNGFTSEGGKVERR
jgi:hypothetical protein